MPEESQPPSDPTPPAEGGNEFPLPRDLKFEKLKQQTAEEKARDRRVNRIGMWVGIAGFVIAIPSLIWGYLGYKASVQYPQLSYAINPLKAELQRPDDDDLAFTYKGQPINSKSVTAVQIAIWNDGTKSIRGSEVLEPTIINLPEGTRILSAKLKNVSREVCKLQLQTVPNDLGKVRVTWHILEPGDLGTFQLIYVGGADIKPWVSGIIEGQKGITEVRYTLPNEVERRPRVETWIDRWGGKYFVALLFVSLAFLKLSNIEAIQRRRRLYKVIDVSFKMTCALVILIFVTAMLISLFPGMADRRLPSKW